MAGSPFSPASSSSGCSEGWPACTGLRSVGRHPVYRALHRPLTVCGVDRRLFFLALLVGVATFNLFYSFAAGLGLFLGLYGAAWAATGHDPHLLRVMLRAGDNRTIRPDDAAGRRSGW